MSRLLVTGGAGFIGANFVHHWLHHHPGDRLVVVDALTYAGNLANLAPIRARPEFRFVHADIRDTNALQALLREERLDTIVHFAAESHVDRSISGPDAFIQTNVMGTHSLLKAAREVWLEERSVPQHRFHHVSTDEVYGSLGAQDPPFTERTPYAPNSPYSASKAASDHLVRAYHHTYGLQVTTSNCSNNYGPYHFPEKLIPLTIVNILDGKPLPVYGDGRNVRDWLHVTDHCRKVSAVHHEEDRVASLDLDGEGLDDEIEPTRVAFGDKEVLGAVEVEALGIAKPSRDVDARGHITQEPLPGQRDDDVSARVSHHVVNPWEISRDEVMATGVHQRIDSARVLIGYQPGARLPLGVRPHSRRPAETTLGRRDVP